MSLFAVPDWDETKNTVSYDFQKKKIKHPKKSKQTHAGNKVANNQPESASPSKNAIPAAAPEEKTAKNKKQKNKKGVAQPEPVNNKKETKSLAIPMKAKDKKNSKAPAVAAATSSSSLADKLKDSLKSSRFRFINEELYKSKSSDAVKMFREDPEAFSVYHEGYRQQVTHWPSNPLDRIIKAVRKMPKEYVIADFGCGDAKLSESVSQKVYSLDLVATRPEVVACDMAKTPLKSETINVVVFCLSLMGTNLRDFLVEANRVLKPNGLLKVAEVKSRFENVDDFLQHVQSCGFKVTDKDVSGEFFYHFNFKKISDAMKLGNQYSLKPCLYKKR